MTGKRRNMARARPNRASAKVQPMLKKCYGVFCQTQNFLISAMLVALVGVVLLGAFCRYTQTAILNWPDELTRYLMVWIVFIGSGSAASNNTHFRIEMLFSLLTPRRRIIVNIFKAVLVSTLYAFAIYISRGLCRKMLMMGQVSPAMGIPMWIMYLSVPIGCALMLIQGLICDVREILSLAAGPRKEEA